MKCKCGEQGKLKIFNTFKYYYCNKCKAEIEKPEEKPFDPFDPNTGSVDDFYLDLTKKELRAVANKANPILRDLSQTLTITLPVPQKGQRFKIYSRNVDNSFEELNIRSSKDGKYWKFL